MDATPEVTRLRVLIAEPDNAAPYTDQELLTQVSTHATVELAAAAIWRGKAAQYAELVNVSEAGSSRSLGDLYKQALYMADQFTAAGTPAPVAAATRTRVGKITRS